MAAMESNFTANTLKSIIRLAFMKRLKSYIMRFMRSSRHKVAREPIN